MFTLFLATIAAEAVVDVDERESAVMLVMTPNGAAPGTRTADLLRTAAAKLEAKTNLRLSSPEQVGADLGRFGACPESTRLSCWVREVRQDYDRRQLELANGDIDPYEVHLGRLRDEGRTYPRFLIVVAIYPRPGGVERLTAMLIATNSALHDFHEARRREGWREEVENRIFGNAVRAAPGTIQTSDPKQVEAFFAAAFGGAFRSMLESGGYWEPHGAVRIAAAANLVVELDGKVVGTTGVEPLTLTGLMPGERRLRVTDPTGSDLPLETAVLVERKKTKTVEVALEARPNDSARTLRAATLWSGVGVAAVGVALTAWGALAPRGAQHVRTCRGEGCEADNAGFATACELSSDLPHTCDGGGVLAAPLGYSMLAVGGVWAAGTLAFGDDDDLPWIQLVAGAAVGALSYGLSAALNPGD